MGSKYSSQATSGYNSSAPPDDGTQVAANLVTWAGVKTKLADVLKTFGEAINTALVSALDLSARAISSNDTAVSTDHWRTLQVTGTTTIQLSSAASMGAGYEVGILNIGAGVVTITPAGSDTINSLSASITVPIKSTIIFRTNSALSGYNIVGQSNRIDAGNIDGAVIGATTPAAGTFTTVKASTTMGVGAATPSASGAGISFPATQSASSDANTLDDYEEGTWVPAVGGSATYTTQQGRYTKIGRVVYIDGILTINAIGTGSTTNVSGLPFTAIESSGLVISVFTSSATNVVYMAGQFGAGTSTFNMFSLTAAGATMTNNAIFGNSTGITFSGFYRI